MKGNRKDKNSIDSITTEGIVSYLDGELRSFVKLEILEKTTSTNALMKHRAMNGESEGLVIVAGEQTEGRGRLGRSFFSPGDTGLYMSVLLRPQIKPEKAVMITTAAAVSVCEALEKSGATTAAIKWVNDVFVDNRKVCGILTEAGFCSGGDYLDYVVLGIGVNVYAPDSGFPDEISDIAGAVFRYKQVNLRNKIAAEILNSFLTYYKTLDEGDCSFVYRERCFVTGKQVDVICGDSVSSAMVLGVNDDCSLNVQFPDGRITALKSGEISIKVKN